MGDIAHNIMSQWPARARGAGNNEVVIPFPHFLQKLINNETVPDADLDSDAEFFERFFFRRQITAKFRVGSEQSIHIFLQFDEMSVNRGRLGHDMEQGHLGA